MSWFLVEIFWVGFCLWVVNRTVFYFFVQKLFSRVPVEYSSLLYVPDLPVNGFFYGPILVNMVFNVLSLRFHIDHCPKLGTSAANILCKHRLV